MLQFYGSNETGALSRTTLRDSRDVRLRTAGHVIPEMQVRLFDGERRDVTATGRGQPGCRGPLASAGYWNDAAANAQLFTADGWMLTGDIAEIDADGVLSVVGRTADIIIRGGKNISAPVVEAAVMSHPAVALAAAVPVPDPGVRRARVRGGGAARRAGRSRSTRSSPTCARRACRWSRGRSACSCSTSCRARPVARSRRERCAKKRRGSFAQRAEGERSP